MKTLAVLVVLVGLLSGCGGRPGEMEAGLALRSRLLQGQGCSFQAAITADYGDKLYDFAMDCQGDGEGNLNFTVTKPETIAGITGKIQQQLGRLTFDEAALQFDPMADGQLSPVSGPWVFLKTLRSGCITSACTEEGQIRLSMDDSFQEEALHLDIWLEEEFPVRSEIRYGNRRILTLAIENFQIS